MVATLQEAFGNTFIENFGDVVAGTNTNNPNYKVGKAKSDCTQPRFINNMNCDQVILETVCAQDYTCGSNNKCVQVKYPDQEKLIRCKN